MNFSEELQAEIETLHEGFTQREVASRTRDTAPEDDFLVVRCDGIRSSKHFLKDALENPKYRMALHRAVETTYTIWRQWAAEKDQPFLLGAIRFSDEVSFFINRGQNYFERRIMKTTTSLASTLTGAMSLRYRPEPASRSNLVTFDGRPLILASTIEVLSYIRWRRLLHARNSMAKTLRLRSELSDDVLYGDKPWLADDIHQLGLEILERGLWRAFEEASGGGSIYSVAADGGLRAATLPSYPDDDRAVRSGLESWPSSR